MDDQLPVFIVGAPRSGTTLLAALISSHSKIACGPETHFFSKTGAEERLSAVNDPNWPETAVKLLTSITLLNQNVYKLFGFKRDEIEDYLRDRAPSQQAMLESLTQQFASSHGKSLWAEKTPNHILSLVEITSLYPNGKIVHIVRDPRDVSRSMTKLPWASGLSVVNSYLWQDWIQCSQQHKANIFTVRYEDLLAQPPEVLQSICEFIGVQFEDAMVDPSSSAENVVSENETWKEKVTKPIDPSNAFKWKRDMPRREAQAVSLICHEGIEQHGYPDFIRVQRTIPVYGLTRSTADRIHEDIVALAERQILLEPVRPHKLKQFRVLGTREMAILEPLSLGTGRLKRLLNLMRICGRVFLERARGTVVYRWPGLASSPSLSGRLIEMALSALTVRIEKISDE